MTSTTRRWALALLAFVLWVFACSGGEALPDVPDLAAEDGQRFASLPLLIDDHFDPVGASDAHARGSCEGDRFRVGVCHRFTVSTTPAAEAWRSSQSLTVDGQPGALVFSVRAAPGSEGTPVVFGAGDRQADSVERTIRLPSTPTEFALSLDSLPRAELQSPRNPFWWYVDSADDSEVVFEIAHIRWLREGDTGTPPTDEGTPDPEESPLTLPFVVDEEFGGRFGFSAFGEARHVEDDQCPVRAGGQAGSCHRFAWDGVEGPLTGAHWVSRDSFFRVLDEKAVPSVVRFSAWGAQGGEVVEFMVGISGVDFDGRSDREVITLTDTPAEYTIALDEMSDVDQVFGAFGWSANWTDNPEGLEFFVDDIRWLGGEAPPLPEGCVDTSAFDWSVAEPILPDVLTRPVDAGLGLDAARNAVMLANEVYSLTRLSLLRYDAALGAWSAPDVLDINVSFWAGDEWLPRVALSPAGTGVGTYLERRSGGNAVRFTVNPDGSAGTLQSLGFGGGAVAEVDDTGHVAGAVTRDTSGILSIRGFETGSPVKLVRNDSRLVGFDLDAQGQGMLFARDGGADYSALLYDKATGWGDADDFEEVPVPTTDAANGRGVWLGGGRALFAYQVFETDRGFLMERSPSGEWSAPEPYDQGMGFAQLGHLVSGAPGVAFLQWEEGDVEELTFVARYDGAAVVDVLELEAGRVHEVVADRCGNAVVLKDDPAGGLLQAVTYVAGAGWQAPAFIPTSEPVSPESATAAFAPSGHGMVVFTTSDAFLASRWE